MITNIETGTRIDEVASEIYRICTPLDVIPGGFTFNSYLIAGEEPLLFHTGYRKLFPITLEAIGKVVPVEKLRWIGGSHFEGDEFGALNELLEAAPEATPFGAEVGVLTSLNDFATRPARGLGVFHRQPPHEVALYTARSARLGLRHPVRSFHEDAAVRGSVHATWRELAARDRDGSAHSQRRHARDDGLLRPREEYVGHFGSTGGTPSVDARLSAWERLSW